MPSPMLVGLVSLLGLLGVEGWISMDAAWAITSAGNMPWETQLDQLVQAITGPIARAGGVFAIIFVAFGLAFSDGGSSMTKLLWVVLGLSLAFAAVTWALPWLGYGGGMLIG